MPRLSIPPFRTEPIPLHCEHATIRRSPHLLHIPSDLLWEEAMNPSTLGAAMVAPSSRAPTTKPAISLPVRPSISPLSALSLSCCTVGRGTELLGGEPARGRERLTLRVGGGRGQPCQPAVTQCRTPPNCRLEDEAVDRGSGSVGLVKITS